MGLCPWRDIRVGDMHGEDHRVDLVRQAAMSDSQIQLDPASGPRWPRPSGCPWGVGGGGPEGLVRQADQSYPQIQSDPASDPVRSGIRSGRIRYQIRSDSVSDPEHLGDIGPGEPDPGPGWVLPLPLHAPTSAWSVSLAFASLPAP